MSEKMSEQERNEKFLELIGPHYQALFSYARYLTGSNESAEDLLQSTSLNALKHIKQLKSDAKFKSWFFTIMHNTYRNMNRRQEYRKTSHVEDEVLQRYIDQNNSTGDIYDKIIDKVQINEALKQLPPQLRETLLLFEREGLSISEIAGIMKRSESAIKHRLRMARDQLRIHYFGGLVNDESKNKDKDLVVDES